VKTLIVRQVDETLKLQLRMRAAKNGRSMEEEVRYILRMALRFEPLGGVDLELPEREPAREVPDLFE